MARLVPAGYYRMVHLPVTSRSALVNLGNIGTFGGVRKKTTTTRMVVARVPAEVERWRDI